MEDEQGAAGVANIEVPAEHADILTRAVKLLSTGEQWVVDNVHAGITTLEGMMTPAAPDKGDENNA